MNEDFDRYEFKLLAEDMVDTFSETRMLGRMEGAKEAIRKAEDILEDMKQLFEESLHDTSIDI